MGEISKVPEGLAAKIEQEDAAVEIFNTAKEKCLSSLSARLESLGEEHPECELEKNKEVVLGAFEGIFKAGWDMADRDHKKATPQEIRGWFPNLDYETIARTVKAEEKGLDSVYRKRFYIQSRLAYNDAFFHLEAKLGELGPWIAGGLFGPLEASDPFLSTFAAGAVARAEYENRFGKREA